MRGINQLFLGSGEAPTMGQATVGMETSFVPPKSTRALRTVRLRAEDKRVLAPRRALRLPSALVVAAIVSAAFAAPSPAAMSAKTPSAREVVTLVKTVWVRARPSSRARIVQRMYTITPFSYRRTVVPILESAVAASGAEWIRVPLGERPNG